MASALVSKAQFLEQAQEAASRGEWEGAFEALSSADQKWGLEGAELAQLADIAYAAGHLDITVDTWERAHAEALRAGEHGLAGGAAVRVAMHLLFDTALMAPVRGWMKRAERLLQGDTGSSALAWLAVVRNYERLLSGDFNEARQWAKRAIELGSEHDPAAAAIGRVAEARNLILNGDVSEGLDLLNEAGVATASGELDPLSTGIVYCELVCAFQGLAQYDLAEEWTQAMEQWRHGQPAGSVHGRCRVHRAEILRLRGSHAEAEQEALTACQELRPYLRRELGWPLNELGRIRLQRGDIGGAREAFTAARETGWDPQPGLALVHLSEGDPENAAASLKSALEHPSTVPSKELPPNTELRKAPLLEAQVEIELALGNAEDARSAAEELQRIAEAFGSKALAASAALALGRVALVGEHAADARAHFETALQLWIEIGAPYEEAQARIGLGAFYAADGEEDEATTQSDTANRILRQIGIGEVDNVSTLSDQVVADEKQTGALSPLPADQVEDGNVFRREGDYWTVAFGGQTVRLRDLKGMRYLCQLLRHPGRSFHTLELVADERKIEEVRAEARDPSLDLHSPLGALPILDAQAKQAYRRRLQEIEEDIEEAQTLGSDERLEQAEAERDFIVREFARAVGLGGRDRNTGSPAERSRVSVTRAIRLAMARIGEHHPGLAEHLEVAVRTGTYCSYVPDSRLPTHWSL